MIKAAIFDLGNVLLHFDHTIVYERIRRYSRKPEFDGSVLLDLSAAISAFECGAIRPAVFFEQVRTVIELDESLTFEEFSRYWAEIFWKNDELVQMLPLLSSRIPIHMLSNTNELHIEYAERTFPEVFEPFTSTTFSFQTGTAKPDTEIFELVLESAGAAPDECLYFDDIGRYVDAARALGINAHQYVSVQGVLDVCTLYQIQIGNPAAAAAGHVSSS